jgi:hypothetical protein
LHILKGDRLAIRILAQPEIGGSSDVLESHVSTQLHDTAMKVERQTAGDEGRGAGLGIGLKSNRPMAGVSHMIVRGDRACGIRMPAGENTAGLIFEAKRLLHICAGDY